MRSALPTNSSNGLSSLKALVLHGSAKAHGSLVTVSLTALIISTAAGLLYGTVCLASFDSLEEVLLIIAHSMQLLTILYGGPTTIAGFVEMAAGINSGKKKTLSGVAALVGGLVTPGCINWQCCW
ncbi:MAG: hypothetical protein K2Z81_19120 [Cyanobacteria bacterium]|nr:hypothetical protein [Cyanobacteriota bacterium]